MAPRWIHKLATLDLEERILNAASVTTIVGVFLPWISGEWLGGDSVTYTGLQFYTSFLGIAVLLMQAFIVSLTAIPLATGSALVSRGKHEVIRFALTMQSTVLLVAALSVLTKVTFEFSRIEVRFGIYVGLIGSIISSMYAFLKLQQHRKLATQDLFRHPDDAAPAQHRSVLMVPQAPPPPPPLQPESHHVHRS